MRLRVVAVLAVLATLALSGSAGAAPRPVAEGGPFFGRAVPDAGATLRDVELEDGRITAKTIAITTSDEDGVTGTAELITHGGATVTGQLTWTGEGDWRVEISRNSARGFTPPNALAIDLDHIDGAFGRTDGERTDTLLLHDYALGAAIFDVPLDVANGGFAGTAELEDVVLGGITYPRLAVTVATAERSVRLEGAMRTELGAIRIDSRLRPSRNPDLIGDLDVRATGAELVFDTDTFAFTDFRFSDRTTVPRTGCTVIDAPFTGTVRWGREGPLDGPRDPRLRAIEDGTLRLACDRAERFRLAFRFQHRYRGVPQLDTGGPYPARRGRLRLALDTDGGTFDEYHAVRFSPYLPDYLVGVKRVPQAYAIGLIGTARLPGRLPFWDAPWGRPHRGTMRYDVEVVLAVHAAERTGPFRTYSGGGGDLRGPHEAGHFKSYGGSFVCSFWENAVEDFACRGTFMTGLEPNWVEP